MRPNCPVYLLQKRGENNMNINPDISKFLKQISNQFKSLTERKRKRIVQLILHSVYRRHKHRVTKRFDHLNSISFQATHLQKLIGDGYQNVISHYFDKPDDDYSYKNKYGKSYTKRYKIKKAVSDMLEKKLLSNKCVLIDSDTDRRIKKIDRNAILKVYRMNDSEVKHTCKTNIYLPLFIKGDLKLLKRRIDNLKCKRENSIDNAYQKQLLTDDILKLSLLYHMLNNTIKPGYMPQHYYESISGRLVGSGFHLISLPNDIRKLFFEGQNLYDYDISNCHYSILSNLCRKNNIKCPNIDYYINNKNKIRHELSEEFNIPVGKVKKALISIIYGSKLLPHKDSDLLKALKWKSDELKRFRNDNIISGLKNDVRKARKILISKIDYTRPNRFGSGFKNVFDKYRINNTENDINKEISSKFYHILAGYEALIINEIYDYLKNTLNIDNPMTAIIYDGWIGEDVDIDSVCAHIKAKLDLDIGIDKEKLENRESDCKAIGPKGSLEKITPIEIKQEIEFENKNTQNISVV